MLGPANVRRVDQRELASLDADYQHMTDVFDVMLGPDFNKAHRDHFHLDMGRFRTCR